MDTFYVTLIGKGGHRAAPHKTVDPIYILGYVILGLHGIVSRRLDPMAPAVISIGAVHGGHTDNVIPDRVELKGTIRYTKPEVQRQIPTEIERVLQIARALGGDYELRITTGYPPMVNDAGIGEVLRRVVVDLLGEEGLHPPHLGIGAEDFGFFSALAPGAMFDLGCRLEGDERVAHSLRFDIDERCLPIGIAVLAESALRLLRGER